MSDDEDSTEAATPRVRGAQTLERGLDLLEQVVRQPMRLSELCKLSGLSRGTTIRLVNGLVERGFLAMTGEGMLRAGPMVFRLGAAAEIPNELLRTAEPFLRALSDRTGLCSFLGRRDGDDSVHLHRNVGAQRVVVATPVGTRRRLPETSLGKALLLDDPSASLERLFAGADPAYVSPGWRAEMAANAAAGLILHRGPPPDSIRAIAAPVRDGTGRIAGAISVASVAQYLDEERMIELAGIVKATADAISEALGCPLPRHPRLAVAARR
jgi:DNA-binding IclR family transcriptional regulator